MGVASVTGPGPAIGTREHSFNLLRQKEFGETARVTWRTSMLLIASPFPIAQAAEKLDQVLADFLLQPPGPLGALLNSRGPLGWLGRLIERHHLKPQAKDAAEGLKGVQAGGGAAAHVADRIGAAGGKHRKLPVGDTRLVDHVK